jgi:hypothetical protein
MSAAYDVQVSDAHYFTFYKSMRIPVSHSDSWIILLEKIGKTEYRTEFGI